MSATNIHTDAVLPSSLDIAQNTQPTKAQLSRALHAAARHGNYHSYYDKFREQTIPDSRLNIIPDTALRNAKVLDLGCNAGKLTAETLSHFAAAAATGVDIDSYLINQARSAYPNVDNLQFECLDFMQGEIWQTSEVLSQKYDVVFLFSVTKWLHLNCGDDKMVELFGHIYESLNADGYLVVEPQGWENYARATKKNASLRPTYKTLKLRPPFAEELKAARFVQVVGVDRDEFGFERSVHVWKKV